MVKKASKAMSSLESAVATAAKTEKAEPLTQQELIAIVKKAEKELEALEKRDGKLGAFTAEVDCLVHVSGTIVRAASTEVTPNFCIADFLKPLLLKYAATLENPTEWLTQIMSAVLPKVIELGSANVLATVSEELQAIWNENEAKAKALFQANAKKQPRSGNTAVKVDLVKEKR